MSNGSKQCSQCGQIKSLSEFYRRALSADGRAAACSRCQKRYREKNRDKVRESSRRYREQNREKVREASRHYYQKNRGKAREAQRHTRRENSESAQRSRRKYRERNREKVLESSRRWNNANPILRRIARQRRRARERNAPTYSITLKDFRRLSSDNCIACGAPANSVDHLIPLSRGGSHGVGNLAPMCRSCNSKKNTKTIAEWRWSNGWLPLGEFRQGEE